MAKIMKKVLKHLGLTGLFAMSTGCISCAYGPPTLEEVCGHDTETDFYKACAKRYDTSYFFPDFWNFCKDLFHKDEAEFDTCIQAWNALRHGCIDLLPENFLDDKNADVPQEVLNCRNAIKNNGWEVSQVQIDCCGSSWKKDEMRKNCVTDFLADSACHRSQTIQSVCGNDTDDQYQICMKKVYAEECCTNADNKTACIDDYIKSGTCASTRDDMPPTVYGPSPS